jgi:hypothetical protein
MDPASIAVLAFYLLTAIPFVAFLWFACDVRSLKHEERERELRDKQAPFQHSEIVTRIKTVRADLEAGKHRLQPAPNEPRHKVAIREAIAAKSFFRRRRKNADVLSTT